MGDNVREGEGKQCEYEVGGSWAVHFGPDFFDAFVMFGCGLVDGEEPFQCFKNGWHFQASSKERKVRNFHEGRGCCLYSCDPAPLAAYSKRDLHIPRRVYANQVFCFVFAISTLESFRK